MKMGCTEGHIYIYYTLYNHHTYKHILNTPSYTKVEIDPVQPSKKSVGYKALIKMNMCTYIYIVLVLPTLNTYENDFWWSSESYAPESYPPPPTEDNYGPKLTIPGGTWKDPKRRLEGLFF